MKYGILLLMIFLIWGVSSFFNTTPVDSVDPGPVIDINFNKKLTGLDYNEVECLAKNIYFEGRGETVKGQIAIAEVTANRVKSKQFPDTFCEVVKQGPISTWYLAEKYKVVPLLHKCQFSWYCDGKSDTPTDLWSWGRAINIAVNTMTGENKDPTNGSMYYHNDKVNPNWDLAMTKEIDHHIFYR